MDLLSRNLAATNETIRGAPDWSGTIAMPSSYYSYDYMEISGEHSACIHGDARDDVAPRLLQHPCAIISLKGTSLEYSITIRFKDKDGNVILA